MAESEYTKLVRQLNDLDDLYYNSGSSVVPDSNYDALEQRLAQLTPEGTLHRRIIGSPISSGVGFIHTTPMLSLDKVYSIKEIRSWFIKIRKDFEDASIVVDMKHDGNAVSIKYANGKANLMVTRGDGKVGEDISRSLYRIANLPTVNNGIDNFEIRGEVVMPFSVYDKINEAQPEDDKYSNARNACAGVLHRKTKTDADEGSLVFIAYDIIIPSYGYIDHLEKYAIAKSLGFDCGRTTVITDESMRDLEEVVELYTGMRGSIGYPTDGLVFTINSNKVRDELGTTSKHPKYAIALKWDNPKTTTYLHSVDWSIGRSGVLTPVAILSPVTLSGVMITRATLHNVNEINRLGITEGCFVELERGGDVIPKITKAWDDLTRLSNKPITKPTKCPYCQGSVSDFDGEVRCVSKECPDRDIEGLLHYASKDVMDFKGIGKAIVSHLYSKGILRKTSDFYRLPRVLSGVTDKVIDRGFVKTLDDIRSKTRVPFSKFILSLMMDNVGKGTSRILSENYSSIEDVASASIEELCNLPDIGIITATSIHNWFSDSSNKETLAEFLRLLSIEYKTGNMKGIKFVFTGEFELSTRKEYTDKVISLGASVSSSVSSNTSYLVFGVNGTEHKEAKALQLGIPVLGEHDLIDLLNSH